MRPEAAKSALLLITHNATQRRKDAVVEMMGQRIERKSSATFLGCKIDEWLSWKEEVEGIIRKATPRVYMVNRLVPAFKKTPDLIYGVLDTMVYSTLRYSAPAYLDAKEFIWEKVNRLQQKALKLLNGFPPHMGQRAVLEDAGRVPLRDKLRIQAGKRMEGVMRNNPRAGGLALRTANYGEGDRRPPTLLQHYMRDEYCRMKEGGDCVHCRVFSYHPCVKNRET